LVKLSIGNYTQVTLTGLLGETGYAALAADFDGDGLADPAVAETSTGNWKIKLSSGNYSLVDLPGFLGE